MKHCTKCQRAGIRESETYCPNCGSRELVLDQSSSAENSGETESRGKVTALRLGAFMVDLLLVTGVSLLTNFIPIVPAIVVIIYLLMRDYRGASLGKLIFGLQVAGRFGGPATALQRILRNFIFALPALALIVPLLGFLADAVASLAIYFVELVLLLATGTRFGDKIAVTTVVRARPSK